MDISTIESKIPTDGDTYLGNDGLLHCSRCGGFRETIINPFGQERKVKCICDCMAEKMRRDDEARTQGERELKRKACFDQSNMWKWTFEHDDQHNPKVSEIMKNYVKNFTELKADGKGLLLYGSVGTGKSYMAACVANALIDEGYSVMMTNFARLTNTIQGMFDGKQRYIDSLNQKSLLIIDDLGAERKSEFMQEMVFNIVDARYRAGLPLIITTNLSLNELLNPGDIGYGRIYDRILERCHPIEVSGTSLRKKKIAESSEKTRNLLGL